MISQAEFNERRLRVLDAMLPNSICVVSAARIQTRSRDTEFPFRQASDFHYLCGFPEPDAVLVLSNAEEYDGRLSVLFCLEKDPMAEIWHGRRIGPESAATDFGFNLAYALDEIEERLTDLIDGHQHLYFAQGESKDLDDLVFGCVQALRDAPKQTKLAPSVIVDVRPLLHEMRLLKSDAELEIMRQACEITAKAHCRAMKFAEAGRWEYQLEAELHHEFAMHGARYPAYGTIVGSGENACILHYTENQSQLVDGDLVLIDAGAELFGYAADITRTFPVSGKFSEPQAILYDLVLEAQLASFSLLKPGNTLKQATDKAIEVITAGLIANGLLQGELQENIDQKTYRAFFMHGLSHWLGLDVHDVGAYKVNKLERPLAAGMVITVEPGIYIAPDAEVEAKWRGIGIRIEDNLVITENGYDVMTEGVPKQRAEIEQLMASNKD